VRSCTGSSSNRPSGPCSTIIPSSPVCDLARIQHFVDHDDHRYSGLCHAANAAQHPACQVKPSLVVAAGKESGPLAVICSAASVCRDKPVSPKADGHAAAAAAVFTELINVRAPKHVVHSSMSYRKSKRYDRRTAGPCRVCGDTRVTGRFRRLRSRHPGDSNGASDVSNGRIPDHPCAPMRLPIGRKNCSLP
jgi:hypothetical protein